MSLYYETARVIEDVQQDVWTLKQRVYNDKTLKSSPGAVFALASESIKWSEVLTEVIDNSRLLHDERKLTPALSLLLTHDLLLSKKGLSTSKKQPLHAIISKHKARLASELTRVRIRRGQPSLPALLETLTPLTRGDTTNPKAFHPRWTRVNVIKTTTSECLQTHFASYTSVQSLEALAASTTLAYCLDPHVPDLVAFSPGVDLTKTRAYSSGHLILQDKASCFPAYLLDPATLRQSHAGHDMYLRDGCAAPGNKTTHLAAVMSCDLDEASRKKVIACERNTARAETLYSMVTRAGASALVSVKKGQDFLALKASDCPGEVVGILLDPSCSGSGIVGRDDSAAGNKRRPIALPSDPRATDVGRPTAGSTKKRKRGAQPPSSDDRQTKSRETRPPPIDEEQEVDEAEVDSTSNPDADETRALPARLAALSSFQIKLVKHALISFPGARRVTYSTCSVHAEEHEAVVVAVLSHPVVRERGWRIMRREEQVDGLRRWTRRGQIDAVRASLAKVESGPALDVNEIAEGCIRCVKGSDEGTMGFFVAGFVRDGSDIHHVSGGMHETEAGKVRETEGAEQAYRAESDGGGPEDEWTGLSD